LGVRLLCKDSCSYFDCVTLTRTLAHLQVHTHRWLPSAWPSKRMIDMSPYLQSIISKPFHTYCSSMLIYSPVSLAGIVYGFSNIYCQDIDNFILVVWPLAFIVALTLLGVFGAGYQLRFLTPVLPASSVLAGYCMDGYLNNRDSLFSVAVPVGIVLLLCYSAIHCLYYGVLFAPLYAEFDETLVGVLLSLLTAPYYAPQDRLEMQNIFKFLAHFGLSRKIQ
jgi:hypothetical protein